MRKPQFGLQDIVKGFKHLFIFTKIELIVLIPCRALYFEKYITHRSNDILTIGHIHDLAKVIVNVAIFTGLKSRILG